jgi:hypothetical protein
MAAAEQPITEPRRGEFRAQTERVEKLADKLDRAGDPEVRAAALELVQSVIELHGAALQRMIDKCLEIPNGERLLEEVLQDGLVASMFLLHSLHPDDIETRVLRGLEGVRPYLKSHGGDCDLWQLSVVVTDTEERCGRGALRSCSRHPRNRCRECFGGAFQYFQPCSSQVDRHSKEINDGTSRHGTSQAFSNTTDTQRRNSCRAIDAGEIRALCR